jgi:hypothetical protein
MASARTHGAEDGQGLVVSGYLDETERVDEPAVPDLVCSARACSHHAEWALRWNNPKLHTPERRKTWLACDDHRESLSQFLSLRGFLRETIEATELQRH